MPYPDLICGYPSIWLLRRKYLRIWIVDLFDTTSLPYSWACSWSYCSSPVRCLFLRLLTQICLYETVVAETIPLSGCHWPLLGVPICRDCKSWITRCIKVATTLSITVTTWGSIEHGRAIESRTWLVEHATFIDIQLPCGVNYIRWYVFSIGVKRNATLATCRWGVVCACVPKGTIACCRWPLFSLNDPLSEILPHFETYMLTSTSVCTLANSNVLRLVQMCIELSTLVQVCCIAKYGLWCRLRHRNRWPAIPGNLRWRLFSGFCRMPSFSRFP